MGQGVAGLADMASTSVIDQAKSAAPPLPPPPAVSWRDIPKTIWNALTEDPAVQQARALEVSKRNLQPLVPAAQKIQTFARSQFDFGKSEGDKIEGQLGPTGKVAMKAVEQIPSYMASGPRTVKVLGNAVYGVATEIGKAKAVSASLPSLAANAIVPGNSKAANIVQPIAEEIFNFLRPRS